MDWSVLFQIAQVEIPILGSITTNQLGLLVFFLGGLAIAISPCLFPILPLTLLRLFGAESKKKALILTTVLLSGVILAFMVYTILATVLFNFMNQYFKELNALMGFIVIIIGIFLIIPQLREITAGLPGLQPDIGSDGNSSYLDVFILGLSYSLIAIPCAGTIYIGLLGIIRSGDILFTMLGFPFFAIGLALPYYVLALSASEFRMQIAQWMARKSNIVNIIMGILLVVIGLGLVLPWLLGGNYWWVTIGEDELTWLILIVFGILILGALGLYIYRNWIVNDHREL